jgi:hypothetical protein
MLGGWKMSKKKREESIKLSFESDGKMGNSSKQNQKNRKEVEFFNTTPSSE